MKIADKAALVSSANRCISRALVELLAEPTTSTIATADEVIAAAADELRLAISHIKGFVSSLRRADVQCDQQTQREFMAEIDQEADRLAEVIDSLLAARPSGADGEAGPNAALVHPAAVVPLGMCRATPACAPVA